MFKILKIFLLSVCIGSCTGNTDVNLGEVDTYVPVYSKPVDLNNIGVEPIRLTAKPGKIYVIGNLLLQNDVNKGVHFIDITNPVAAKKISFLRIPWSTELSVKGGYLYVNNFNDLLVFNINDVQNPSLVKRLENVFPYHNSEYPPVVRAFFECVDKSKGIVVGWELKKTTNPKCRR